MAHRRVRTSALLAAVAILAILAPLPGASVVLDPADDTLRLRMANGSGAFTYQDADPNTSNIVQGFTASKQCGVQGSLSLVTLGAVSGGVGFATHSLGVRSAGEGASGKCEQVNIPNQVLKLRLGSNAALAGKVFDFAELDIEAKFNAAINIRIFNVPAGGTAGESNQVDASPNDGPTNMDLVITCTNSGSDCGPDDSARDNFRVRVPAGASNVQPFTELWLWATGSDVSGAVGLEGGADGTLAFGADDLNILGLGERIGTTDTIFHLQSMIDCEDDPATPNIIENQASATDPQLADITVTRLANVDQAVCSPKAYLIRTAVETVQDEGDVNVVTFLESDDSGQTAHYQMRVSWIYPRRDPVDDPDANPATVGGRTFYIDYTGTGTFVPAQLCPVVEYDTQGDPVTAMHPTDPDLPWCITAQEYTIGSDGMVHLVQDWDGFGDPRSY